MDIKEEDLIRLWRWCGLKAQFETRYPHNPIHPAFPYLTLENIYKFAIPKLQDKGYATNLLAFEQKGFRVNIMNMINPKERYEILGNSPTEALYNAILKVIDNENPPRISDAEYKETCQTYNEIMNKAESKKHNPRLFKGGHNA